MNLFDLYAKIVLDDSGYTDGLEKAGKKTESFGAKLKNGLVAAGKLAAGAIGAASTAITALGKIAIDYNSELENYTSNFTVMLGDAEKAAQKVNELKELGASTPFELGDLAGAAQTLLAFNVSAEDSTDILKQLGDISLGSTQKLESLTRAYGKMNASQKVTLEDINMMIDAGFNPLLVVAEQTGETMTGLYDRVSQGRVSFEEIQGAIATATSEGGQFFGGMETASQTFEGQMSTLKDNVQALIGEVFLPVSEGLTEEVLPAAISAVEELSTAYEENGVTGMIEAAGEIVGSTVGEISKLAPGLIANGVELVDSLCQGIEDNEETIIEGAGDTFFAFADGVAELIPRLLDTATSLVAGLGRYIAENPDEVIESGGEMLAEFAIGVAESIAELAVTAVAMVASLGSYLYENRDELWENAKSVGSRVLDAIWDGITTGWENLKADVKMKINDLLSWVNTVTNNGVGAGVDNALVGQGFSVDGTHASGLRHVPFDGYLAELHQGERVLTAEEARQLDRSGRGVNVIQYIYSEAKTAADLMQEAIYRQEMAVNLGV